MNPGAGNTETLNGANTFSGPIALTSGTLVLSGSGSLGNGNYAGVISGTGGLTMSASGTQILSGASTYSGNTTVTAGTLDLANSVALQNSTLTTAGIAFDSAVASRAFIFGGLSGSGNLALTDTGTWQQQRQHGL
jgi:autotransporter-associated beta strand protein